MVCVKCNNNNYLWNCPKGRRGIYIGQLGQLSVRDYLGIGIKGVKIKL
jgi:hypothetical protein